jgi:hypothetical protein
MIFLRKIICILLFASAVFYVGAADNQQMYPQIDDFRQMTELQTNSYKMPSDLFYPRFDRNNYLDDLLFELPMPEIQLQSQQLQSQQLQSEGNSSSSPRTSGSRFRFIDLDDFAVRLEADRRLLAEIRKDVPEEKVEAETYLSRFKELAAQSDPVRLVPLANRVLSQAPIYLEWLDREFESEEERVTEYYMGGASGFHFALDNFKNAVLLTVINRLDIAARLIRELNPEQQ